MSFFNKQFALTLVLIALAELISLTGFFWTPFNSAIFFVLVIVTLAVSLIKLEYGFIMLFAELLIGSKGYLFSLDLEGINISIRMALWLIVISVFAAKLIVQKQARQNYFYSLKKSGLFYYFIILFFFIVWAVINGLARGNGYLNIFFDANGWLYFLLLFPLYWIFFAAPSSDQAVDYYHNERFKTMLSIFTAAVIWLCFKTFFLLYVFSHNLPFVRVIYHWVRDSGIGEITLIQGGFYRVFFQSHIYLIPAALLFFILLFRSEFFAREKNKFADNIKRQKLLYFLFFSLFLSVNLTTFSRSNWLGLASGSALIGAWIIYKYHAKRLVSLLALSLAALLLSVGLIAVVVKFPYPNPLGGFSTADLLKERASQIAGEAGVSSRWSLLPELWEEISAAPLFGRGFGATVTYTTSDPRILAVNPKGEYTTYAFEWGWLDIWLKLGFFGLLSYFFLLAAVFIKGCERLCAHNDYPELAALGALLAGLAAFVAVNMFSPYFNHPLGIGYLLLLVWLVDKPAERTSS